jgi:hypothetical protein
LQRSIEPLPETRLPKRVRARVERQIAEMLKARP